jgi:RimJ/RimL family protein N-acetyltransferase
MVNKSIALETRRIRLRKIQKQDFPAIFKWRNTEKFRFLFHYDESIVDYEMFCEEFKRDAHARPFQFLIEKRETKEPLGLTFIHSYSEEYHTCFLNLFLSEPFERKGFGTDAFVLFVLFLFNEVGLKRLFAQASDYNEYSIACIRRGGMRELIGNIEKKIHKGKEHDILCFAADETIVPRLSKILKLLTIQKHQQKKVKLISDNIF